MQDRHVPRITPRYWIAITLASVFGANLGDFCSHVLGLGHVRGLPVLAAVFVVILLAERRVRFGTTGFYWMAVVTLRTAATNLSDFVTHDLGLRSIAFVLVLTALVAAMVALGRTRQDPTGDLPDTGGLYWLTMLTAGTLGTAMGDFCADGIGLGPSAAGWLVVWAAALPTVARWPGLRSYWATIVVVRTLGTNLGDLAAGRAGLALGLKLSTALTGLALTALLTAWRTQPVKALSPE